MARNPPLFEDHAPEPLVVGTDARWLRLPSRQRIELPRQRAMRLILLALVRERLTSPGHALTWECLLAHGWPGERMMHDAGHVRVRVALSKLRALGLRELISSRDDGYVLRDDAPVVLEGPCGPAVCGEEYRNVNGGPRELAERAFTRREPRAEEEP